MLIKAIILYRLRAVSDFLFAFCSLININELLDLYWKYWHTSDFFPTVLVHFKTWTVFKWILSKPAVFTCSVCIWSFGRARSSKCRLLCLSVLERAVQAHTHTHTRTHTLQPGEQHLLCGLYFQHFIIKHVEPFSNYKDCILQQSTNDWSDSDVKVCSGRNECAPLWREGSYARRNAAIILRSQKSTNK